MTLQGARRTYELDGLGLNARCRIEEATGRPYLDVLRELAGLTRPKRETAIAFLSALLLDPPGLSPDSLGPILADIGGLPVLRKAAQAVWKTHRPKRRKRNG